MFSNGYGGAPLDEVSLAQQAQPVVDGLGGEVPGTARLHDIAAEHGLELATMVFRQAILASPSFGAFARALEDQPAGPTAGAARARLLIVPAMFYQERPDLGGDGRVVAAIARACGFSADIVPVHSRGSVTQNAAVIRRAIEVERAEELWLYSSSKGGAEVRLALQDSPDARTLDKVRGWINVNGVVHGSPFIDHMLGAATRRLRMIGLSMALGTAYSGLKELRTGHTYWQQPFDPAHRIRVINLVGVPLPSHVQRGLVRRYRLLGRLGPNDGFVLLPETLILPGLVYPVWGADHLFRTPEVSPLLYRVFNYVRSLELESAR